MTEEQQEENYSEEEMNQLLEESGLSNTAKSPDNMHSFLKDIIHAEDTIKLGNLTEEEIGDLKQTLRGYEDIALFAEDVIKNPFLAKYYRKKSKIKTDTSLSLEGFFIKQASLQRREVADKTTRRVKENKGWFKNKKSEPIE